MRDIERGVASFSPAGFGGLDASCRRRVEACLRRCLRAAAAEHWVLGIFASNHDLVAFDTSAADLDDRTALALVCMLPFPESPGPIALNDSAERSEPLPPAIGISVAIKTGCSVAIALCMREASSANWSRAGEAVRSAIAEIVDEIGNADFELQNGVAPPALDGPDAFFLLNPEYDVAVEWFRNNGTSSAFGDLVRPESQRLPLFLEQAVRRLTTSWNFSRIGTCVSRMSRPIHGLALRVVPMVHTGVQVGVFLNIYENGRETDEAVSAFRISTRERDVLYALLDGRSIAEIAEALNLAESTVNDHVARMIAKTKARNRIQMAATLLGWPARKPQMFKNGAKHGATNGAHYDVSDGQGERPNDEERLRPRPSWRYHIGSGGPMNPTDFLP